MSRGRTPNLVPTTQWSIMIPIPLAFQVEMQLLDPVTKKVSYSARSKLIQSLLFEWLQKQGIKPIVTQELFCPDCKRPKATSPDDVVTGACPKWFGAFEHETAEADCAKHKAALAGENSSTPSAPAA